MVGETTERKYASLLYRSRFVSLHPKCVGITAYLQSYLRSKLLLWSQIQQKKQVLRLAFFLFFPESFLTCIEASDEGAADGGHKARRSRH